MINRHKSYVAKLGFKLATLGFAVKHATGCAMEKRQIGLLGQIRFVFLCDVIKGEVSRE